MSELSKGMLVQHASLGTGKVVAIEPTAVHVFFPDAQKRFAAKLRLPAAVALLRTEGVEPNAWLEGLAAFTLDPKEGRYALAETWITHDQAIARFAKEYPDGFADPAYLGQGAGARRARAPHWRAAGAAWADAFAGGEARRLLDAGEVRELVARALRIDEHVRRVPGTFEPGILAQAFSDPDPARPFFEALFELLAAAPGRARTEQLFASALALDVDPELAWPVATLFPFIADPARYPLLWPRVTCAAAERLGYDLRFEALPNWPTYAALRALSTRLLSRLEANGARDLVDVEAFLHAMVGTRAVSPKKRTGRPAASPRTVVPAAAGSATPSRRAR